MRPRQYNVVVYLVPLSFNAGNPEGMREVELTNGLEPNSITATRWIKPLNRRSEKQIAAHAIFTFANPKSANKAIAEQLVVCHKKLDVVKSKREPVRCMKCQLWGHFAMSCPLPHDRCGKCGEQHRTNDCNSPGLFCVPCGIDGHPSWDRDCPTFNAKAREMDQRTPENQLVYYPTDEPWTQQTTDSSWNQFANFRTRGRTMATNTQTPQPSRPLIDRVGPPPKSPHQSRQSRRAWGLLTTGDPSLPTADSRALEEPLPQPESQGNSQRDLPRTRSGNLPDARIRASGRGKARSHPSGSSRSVQLRLDDFQYCPQSQPQAQVAGPSRQSMLSQDITALINPSANPFAPIAPPDTDDLDSAAPPDTQLYPPSSDPPLSPVPSQPRAFPELSPIHNWSDPPPPRPPSLSRDFADSDSEVSFSSNA